MIITLYSFSKKRNSTRRPNSGGLDVDVKLKENCSIYNPTFVLNHNAGDFNYVKVSGQQGQEYWKSTKDLYYWVDDITFLTDRIISAQCSLDPFASAKEDILSTRANVMYCADSSNTDIVDTRIPVRSNVSYIENSIDLGVANEGGIFIDERITSVMLSVTGKGSFGVYMLVYPDDLSEILDGVDNFTQSAVVDILAGLKQLFYGGTASECLKAAISLPVVVSPSDIGASSSERLYLGNYPAQRENADQQVVPIYVYKVNKQIMKGSYSISIPWGSYAQGDWRRCAPYCDFYLYIPFIGTLHLNASDLVNDNVIEIDFAINVTSGDISALVKAVHAQTGERRIISTSSGNLAINTPFGSTGIDTNRLTQSIGAGAAAVGASVAMAATGNLAGAALSLAGGIAAAAGGTLAALGGSGYGDGGLGGGASAGLDKHIRLVNINRTLSDSPANFAATYGKPFMRPDTIGNHSGLVITEGASVSSDLSAALIDTINAGLDGGLYIE